MVVAARRNAEDIIHGDMRKPFIYSLILHVGVFLLATVGLPYFASETEQLDMAITVDLVDPAEISQTNVLDKPDKSESDMPPAPPKPVYNTADTAPDLLSPQIPEIEEDIPEPPKEEVKPEPTPIEKPPKPQNKPRKPPPPKPEKTEDTPKEEDQQDFTSLLKSLTPDEPDSASTQEAEQIDSQSQTSQIADFSKQMTRSELDDLNRGVEPCWNVNAGGKNAETLIVELWVFVNQDRTVRDVQIIDKIRYAGDSHFRVAAEAARRALLNPRCSTLRLPSEKYERWKKFKYIFDPSQML